MEEAISILVENFNIEESKYEFGKQVVTEVTVPLLKEILNALPFGKDVLIPPKITTDKVIIERMNEKYYWYEYNINFSYFMKRGIDEYGRLKRHTFKLEQLEKFFEKKEKSKVKKGFAVLRGLIENFWYLIVILNIWFFIKLLLLELRKPNLNVVFLIFLIWLTIFCVYSLSYGIFNLIKLKKEPRKIKLEYSFPFDNSFETVDVSETIIVFGQFFLNGFTVIYEFELKFSDIVLLVIILILLGIVIFTFLAEYTYNNNLKDLILQRLFWIIHNHLKGIEKQSYMQIAIKLGEKPLISSDKIPRFSTLFSVLLTFIPIISYLFVYS
ncbi:hypothetical protein ES703_82968 [subsurface metagenome]